MCARAESLFNEYCPVIPEEYAHEEFFLEYQGVEVHFCCDRCVDKFRKNPAAYLDQLPELAHRSLWRRVASIELPLLLVILAM